MKKDKQYTSESALKEKAVSFLELVVSGDVREAYRKYVGEDFRHHNPYFPGDAEALMLGMEESEEQTPNKIFNIKHALQDGDSVAVHSHLRQSEDDIGMAVVHIFRFENNQIVEMWDVGQSVPEESQNENGMF
ncbi:polyketide cyclase [Halalkalibacillus sediminis]|uniref:Polyketide cyclase n=1 Tax=Halalkalibacillus sediminis TaxID=2018042 RepID=A0A2I0QQV8_9BACI|nr:nuclear transport factor 2 family protein [Halalkalibacillus sediminis]PKR76725.1 polyketide cyclase [Halalkalibacillus sediminis]